MELATEEQLREKERMRLHLRLERLQDGLESLTANEANRRMGEAWSLRDALDSARERHLLSIDEYTSLVMRLQEVAMRLSRR